MKMLRTICFILTLWVILFMTHNPVRSSPFQTGQPYRVKPGDTLGSIAEKIFGNTTAWKQIFDATNWKSETDADWRAIVNPDHIVAGQMIWLPASADGSALPPPLPELEKSYYRAIQDAETAAPDEISKDLIAIVETNRHLIWSDRAGRHRVLLVTWTSWSGYDDKVGEEMVLARNVWVTTVPELRKFCSGYRPRSNLVLRLEQLLGLPPNAGKTRFVEFWAQPRDLFRPSPDPEVSDHEAELGFPDSKQVKISPDHVAWYNDLKSKSYGRDGYPWTRLGYTYDWGNPASEIGLSEFVVDKGATVKVKAVYNLNHYCR